MGRLLAVAFALIVAIQLILLVISGVLVAMLLQHLWEADPWRGVALAGTLVVVLGVLWRGRTRVSREAAEASPTPQIDISRIPMSGPAGAVYMLQFLVWAILSPAVGLFFAALVGGAVLLLPLVFRLNRPGGGGALNTVLAAAAGALCGAGALASLALVARPLAAVALAALCAGGLAGPLLIWLDSRRSGRPSIAPYADRE